MSDNSGALKAALGATMAIVLVGGIFVIGAQLNPEKPKNGPQNEAVAGIEIPGAPPLNGGEEVSMESAIARFEVPIYRPDTPAASDDSIRDIWMRGGDFAQVYVRYRSGIILEVRPARGMPSNEVWAEELIGDGVDGAIEEVGGVEAFVVQQHLPSLGSVRFFLGDAVVAVIGDGDFSTDELRAAAASAIGRADTVEAEYLAAA